MSFFWEFLNILELAVASVCGVFILLCLLSPILFGLYFWKKG